jgi:hypothetical protein
MDVARRVFASLRGLGGARRLQMAFEMSDDLRRIVECGVRSRHPEYDDEQVRLACNRIWLGPELFREVQPGVEIEP